jgi:hypothetical protein
MPTLKAPVIYVRAENAVSGDVDDNELFLLGSSIPAFFDPVALCQYSSIEVLAEGVVSRAAVRPVVPEPRLTAIVDQQPNGLVAEPKLAAVI